MNTTRILAAGVTGASLLLTSFPASAIGLGLGVNSQSSAYVNTNAVHTSVKADTKATVKADYKAAKADAKADFKAGMQAWKTDHKNDKDPAVTTNVDVDANLSTSVLVKIREQLLSITKRIVTRVGTISKNICNREPNETAVKACLDKAKADFKASVDAMINVSFGA